MVLGETEILGQVARAYQASCDAKTNHKLSTFWFQRGLAVGKKARTETCIDQFPTSISSIAVELARSKAQNLHGQKILLLGAGEMSELTMKHLIYHGAAIVIVTNRSLEKAKKLAGKHNFTAVPFAELAASLKEADIVFSATASQRVLIRAEDMIEIMAERKYRPLMFIDMAVPRDIDPKVKNIKGVSLFDLDDLRYAAEKNKNAKELAAREIVSIIETELARFKKWFLHHPALFGNEEAASQSKLYAQALKELFQLNNKDQGSEDDDLRQHTPIQHELRKAK
jgi:glutamyl-tRNA reductase